LLLIGMHRKKAASAVLAASLIPLAAFSLFLHGLALSLLPTSVLVKSEAFERPAAHASALSMLLDILRSSASSLLRTGNRWAMLALVLLLGFAAWRSADSRCRRIFAAAALLPALQLVLGPFGGFHRYEIYATVFAALILLYAAVQRIIPSAAIFAVLIVFGARSPVHPQHAARGGRHLRPAVPDASLRHGVLPYTIRRQDVGLVSYHKPASSYVLDLSGLNSLEAARAQNRDPAWLAQIARRHRIALAMPPSRRRTLQLDTARRAAADAAAHHRSASMCRLLQHRSSHSKAPERRSSALRPDVAAADTVRSTSTKLESAQ
jgi:hypothetical protein